MRDLLAFCERERAWLLETTEALVRLESPSTDKAAVDRCGRELARRLASIGARVETLSQDRAGDHIRAEFASTALGAGAHGDRQLLLLCHLDTVWPVGQLQRMPLKHQDGCLHGPGTFDMKAGIAIGMQAMRALVATRRAPPCRAVMLLTTDEEIGSTTSRPIIETEARRSEAVLVLEPGLPGGALKTARKGCGEFELRVRGVAAHAGVDPGKGASAILELARQILALEALRDLQRGVSVNVGVVTGGTRSNVVAEEARALVDVRVPTMAAAATVEAAFRALSPQAAGTSLEVAGGVTRPPLERTAGVQRLYEQARAVAAELGRDLQEGSTGGGSDGNFTAALGIPTLDGLGAVGDGAHAIDEHVVIDELPWRAALVAGLMVRLAQGW